MVFACYTILVPLLVFLQVSQNCEAQKLPNCPPTSCGSLRNISHPFRLNTDPNHCGDIRYELVCDNNTAVLNRTEETFHVNDINYQNQTIQVTYAGVQKDNCSSLPVHSGRPPYLRDTDQFYRITYTTITLVRCERAVFSPSYVETTPCINGSSSSKMRYSYAIVQNGTMTPWWESISDLKDSCSIDRSFAITFPHDEVDRLRAIKSFSEIHNALVYGLELRWPVDFTCEQYLRSPPDVPFMAWASRMVNNRPIKCSRWMLTEIVWSFFFLAVMLVGKIYNFWTSKLQCPYFIIGGKADILPLKL